MPIHSRVPRAIAGAIALCAGATARADLTTPYQLVTSFTLPGNTYDLLPDGRLYAIDGTGVVSVQDAINASTYTAVGSIGPVNSGGFDPAFVRLSPDASTIAVGNNEFGPTNAVLFFDAASALSGPASATSTITTPNFSAGWSGNDTLFVSGADGSTFQTFVNRLDVSAGTSTSVISPAGAFSGAVAVTNTGVYAGEGDTGDVYRFDTASLAGSVAAPITDGEFIASNASAGSIDFDNLGNIIIAGAAFDFVNGTFVGSAAVIDPLTGDRQTLTPAGDETFYGAYFNNASGHLVVTAEDGTAYVYAIPAPSTWVPLAACLFAGRRRRSPRPARGEARAERSEREWFACA